MVSMKSAKCCAEISCAVTIDLPAQDAYHVIRSDRDCLAREFSYPCRRIANGVEPWSTMPSYIRLVIGESGTMSKRRKSSKCKRDAGDDCVLREITAEIRTSNAVIQTLQAGIDRGRIGLDLQRAETERMRNETRAILFRLDPEWQTRRT